MPVPTPPVFSQSSWNAGEDVLNTDWNQLIQYVLALGGPIDDVRLDQSAGQLLQRFNSFADAFRVTAAAINSTLILNYTGGVVRLTSGLIATIAPGTLTAPAPPSGTGTSFVWVDGGVVKITGLTSTPPDSGLLLAQITTNTTAVSQVVDLRANYLERPDPDKRIVVAQKSNTTNLTIGNVDLGLPGWSASRNLDNQFDVNNGIFTPTSPLTDIRFNISVQFVCDNPATLAAKVSVFSGSTELKIVSQLGIVNNSGATFLVLSGFFETEKNEVLAAGTPITIQVRVPQGGTNTRVPAGRNTQLIISRL